MGMLDRGYRMGMLGRGYRYSKLIYAGPSQCTNFRREYIFFFYKYIYLFSKAFSVLYVLYTRNLTTLSFDGFLENTDTFVLA